VPSALQATRSAPRRASRRAPAKKRPSRKGRRRGPRTLLTALFTVAAVTGIVTLARLPAGNKQPPSGCTVASDTGQRSFRLSPDQAQNAAIIAGVALRKGLPDHAVTVALATSLQESKLTNLPYGDLDSVGLFQQRPSQGWGTRTQLLDPAYAAGAFYDRLAQVEGWTTMAVTDAAQSVQHSAAPTAYSGWEPEGRALAAALTGEKPAAFACQLASFAGPAPANSALDEAATAEMGSPVVSVQPSSKVGWRVASWVVAHAWRYHIQDVSLGGWAWTSASGRWLQTPTNGSAPGTLQIAYARR
jgi:hypothetical protein